MDGLHTFGGSLQGTLQYGVEAGERAWVRADVHTKRIDVQRLFHFAENFQQEYVQAQHVEGALSSHITGRFPIVEGGVDWSLLGCSAQVTLEHGRLKQLPALEPVAQFLHLPELSDLSFATLTNTFSLQGGVLEIPKMYIGSSALNLFVEGKHDMRAQAFQYQLNLRLRDLLFKKAKGKRQDLLEHSVADGRGGNLFLLLQGSGTDVQVSYDMQALGRHLFQDMRRQQQEIKQLLQGGVFKDTIPPKKEPGFHIEWDDESDSVARSAP